jgi:hypothetical protein
MRAGEYLIDPLLPNDWEPKIWEVARIDRGRVELARVNPTNLVQTGETRRIDLYRAKRMLKYDSSDKELSSLVRALRQYQSQIRRYVDGLTTEAQEEESS